MSQWPLSSIGLKPKPKSDELVDLYRKIALFDVSFLRQRREILSRRIEGLKKIIAQEKMTQSREVLKAKANDTEFITSLYDLGYLKLKMQRLQTMVLLLDAIIS